VREPRRCGPGGLDARVRERHRTCVTPFATEAGGLLPAGSEPLRPEGRGVIRNTDTSANGQPGLISPDQAAAAVVIEEVPDFRHGNPTRHGETEGGIPWVAARGTIVGRS